MFFKFLLLCLIFWNWKITACFLLTMNLTLLLFGKKFFAGFLATFCVSYNEATESLKRKLFQDMDELSDGKMKILEIGGGSGANFKYLPESVELTVTEPNLNFVQYFNTNRQKYPQLDIKDLVAAVGEDLGIIEDNSVDAVICTLVLCTVNDQKKCLQEVKRVLKPGGKFFFMEHVGAPNGTPLRVIQYAMTVTDLWPTLCDGCNLDRDTAVVLEQAGFQEVDITKFELPQLDEDNTKAKMFNCVANLIKPQIMGVATK